jgi:hypothetical protein
MSIHFSESYLVLNCTWNFNPVWQFNQHKTSGSTLQPEAWSLFQETFFHSNRTFIQQPQYTTMHLSNWILCVSNKPAGIISHHLARRNNILKSHNKIISEICYKFRAIIKKQTCIYVYMYISIYSNQIHMQFAAKVPSPPKLIFPVSTSSSNCITFPSLLHYYTF